MPPIVAPVKAGRLHAIAVTSLKRAESLPDVPTVAESGFPGYEDYTYGNVGVSKVMRRLALDLRYFEASGEWASVLGDPKGDAWVLSVSYGVPLGN